MPDTNGPAVPVEDAAAFELFIRRMLGTVVAGFTQTAYGVPIPTLLTLVARQMGFVVGASVIADLPNHLLLRRALRDAFKDGLEAAPKNFPPLPQGMTETAIRS